MTSRLIIVAMVDGKAESIPLTSLIPAKAEPLRCLALRTKGVLAIIMCDTQSLIFHFPSPGQPALVYIM